ncbi:MAG: RES domain-containing protein [Thermoleophilaceae bacterium]|nr:RES domain-containing protein [Thermoleophilaceae bacterium]
MSVKVVEAPEAGVWRVGRSPDPLALNDPLPPSDLDKPHTGNRFDSPTGAYRVLYFATKLEGCYGETLARFRPDSELAALLADEWERLGWMNLGDVPAAWRQRRIAVNVRIQPTGRFEHGARFLDVENLGTREFLKQQLGELLAYWGHPDLDVATVRGGDRRVTRLIGQWAYDQADENGRPLYAGVRYVSRLSSGWECWAVFEDVELEELSRESVLPSDAALQKVARAYGLTVF